MARNFAWLTILQRGGPVETALSWIGDAVESGGTVVVSTHELPPFSRWETARVRLAGGRPVA